MKCSWVKFKWEEGKCGQVYWSGVKCSWVKCSGLSNRVCNVVRTYIDHLKLLLIRFFFVYHILSYSSGSLFYHCIYGCMFCMLLFNFVNYVFLSLYLCILLIMHFLFCIFCFHRANRHSSATLTEVLPCFFLSCNANARVRLAKMGHGPYFSQLVINCVFLCVVNCVVLCIVCA